ncbi:MAG: phosphoglucosamine mutase [Candidatus Nanopelagicales bacterium]|nr:phosphoglucosamine mutase [Candidatus Nanopelagicales bacterium]
MGTLFGTDGVRGLANRDLTADLALDLAGAAAHVLGELGELHAERPGARPRAVVGRDPRASGEFLEAAIVAGLASAGLDVLVLGVLPTPGVAHLTAELGVDLGVMISASHNPMPDNGIKLFARGGHKLADEVEAQIEARLDEGWQRPIGAAVGRVVTYDDALGDYVEHLLSCTPNRLNGLRVVVDTGNGAAAGASPRALRRMGAEVLAIHSSPDGYNINEGCGSTHMADLRAAVVEHGYDVGIAHDGDADRCLAVDAQGDIVDGDEIMAVLALAKRDRGRLVDNTVVATVMSNLGFKLAMQREGITVVETGVGDRYVLEAMRAHGYSLGGEQSGHVVLLDYATTGDGTLTALHLLARMADTGKSLSELASVMTKLPQVLINVRGVDRAAVGTAPGLAAEVAAAQAALGGTGRVLLRPSGTEPLVRVMVEAPTDAQARSVAESLAGAVAREIPLA